MPGINKAELYDSIKKEIEEEGLKSEMPDFCDVMGICVVSGGDFNPGDFSALVADMDRTYFIRPSVPLKGNPIKVFIKRIIRKFTRFYVEPAFNSQTEFNGNTVRAAQMIEAYFQSNGGVCVSDLMKKMEIMDIKLKSCIEDNERLQKRVSALEKENEELRGKTK